MASRNPTTTYPSSGGSTPVNQCGSPDSVAPSGGSMVFVSSTLGLTPQAIHLSPLRGFIYFSTVEFGAVSFVKTKQPQRHRVHREQHREDFSGGVGNPIEMLQRLAYQSPSANYGSSSVSFSVPSVSLWFRLFKIPARNWLATCRGGIYRTSQNSFGK